MATLAEDLDDFEEDAPELDLDDAEDDSGDAHEPDDGDDDESEDEPAPPADDAEEHDVIGWGEEEIDAEPEAESVGMRNLREELKRQRQRVKELEQRDTPKVDEVGEKPNIDDYWDKPEQYDQDLEAWLERKREAKQREERQAEAAAKQQERWQRESAAVEAKFAEIRVPGKDEARSIVEEDFPGQLFAFLVKAAGDNAAALIVGLGKSPEKRAQLKQLADEGSLVEFIRDATLMGKEVRMGARKPATVPEKQHRGSTGGAARTDAKRARLEREAEETGDYSALVRYDSRSEKR